MIKQLIDIVKYIFFVFQKLPGDMRSPCEIARRNTVKNRYGNIVTCKYI